MNQHSKLFGFQRKETLPVSKIQSVKAVRKGVRDIPKAFEIFTGDQTYTFKAKGQQNIEQWVQCLHIAVARSQTDGDPVSSAAMATNNMTLIDSSKGEVSIQTDGILPRIEPIEPHPMGGVEGGAKDNIVIQRPRSVMDTKLQQ